MIRTETFDTDSFRLLISEGHKSLEYPKYYFIGYSNEVHSTHTYTMGS